LSVGADRAVQRAVPAMSNEEAESNISEPECEAEILMEDQQQQLVTVTEDASLMAVDDNTESADQNIELADNEKLATSSLDDASFIDVNTDSVQEESMLSPEPDQSGLVEDVPVSQLTTSTSASTDDVSGQPVQVMSAVSRAGQVSGASAATKSPAFVLYQVANGGQAVFVPRSAVGGIQLSSGTPIGSATSVSHVPVFRSAAVPLRTVSSNVQGVVAVTSLSSSAPSVVGIQTSAGVHLLRPAADGVRVITGNSSAVIRPSITLNRSTTPQRLALAIAPANSAVRPAAGTGSIRLVTVRSGTPLAISGMSAGGSAVGSPHIKLLTAVRPMTSLTTGMITTTSSVPVSASTVSTVRQQTAVSDVQAYLRRIEQLKSSQPDQAAKIPPTLAATVKTPLKAKTALPTTAQQIVVLQSGSQPQLANISASQLVCIVVASCFIVCDVALVYT